MRLILNCKLIFHCSIFILLTYTRILYITYIDDYINHIANVVLLRAGKISVKCFLCKDQTLSLVLSTHTQTTVVGCVCNLNTWSQKQGPGQTLPGQPACMNKWTRALMRNSVSRHIQTCRMESLISFVTDEVHDLEFSYF